MCKEAPQINKQPSLEASDAPWWQAAVAYQIYPRSFADGNGDGIGDLRGIIDHIDHLSDLGIDVLWLSPIYPSPQDDNGYDISDYCDIEPDYGTLADLDELVAALHARRMRLIMDLVVNHTSDEHPWFVESRASRDNPKRDWYVWRDGKGEDGLVPPNNWESHFSGPAWTYDETTGQWYLRIFSSKQPDLNWENPEVREAVYSMMRWWLDRGVDGFRMDVINLISKPDGLPDAPAQPGQSLANGRALYSNGPRLLEYLDEMRRAVLDAHEGCLFTVGETPNIELDTVRKITDPGVGGLKMVFTFEHVNVDQVGSKWNPVPLELPSLKRTMDRWQRGLESSWNSLYWNNHDQPRAVSRWGDDQDGRVASAKAWATVLHLHRGTPYVYQGEEIGMTNIDIRSEDDLLDVQSRNFFRGEKEAGSAPNDEILKRIRPMARDNSRSPMQWTAQAHAGFTTRTPWMPVNANHATINVEDDRRRDDSVFAHYRALIDLRHTSPVVALGDCHLEDLDDERLYVVVRDLDGRRAVMIANLSGEATDASAVAARHAGRGLVVALGGTGGVRLDDVTELAPWQAIVALPSDDPYLDGRA
ncbi:MAG: alpha-glucosidase [Propioniciclava sp.]|uniref:alpha-glucosidase n=1 Tax=Propioniciclava sp. TaxID=2038686 RepID=UPI0039E51C03